MAAQGFVSLDIKAFMKLVIAWLLAYFYCMVACILLLCGNCHLKVSTFQYVLGVTGFPNSERMSYL